jgi:DNA-binding GntR family transcriptional regulator
MSRDPALERSVLSEQVKGHLLRAILDGRYPPGVRIVETRVARELGMSQAPVREALRDLEALGVVETVPFRGARTRLPSNAELLEAFAVRSVVEGLAGRLAVEHLGDDDPAGLATHLEEMDRAAIADDPYAEARADAAFHGAIVRLARNRTLERVWQTLEPVSRTYITLVAAGPERRHVAAEHEPILAALRARDADRVVSALDEHFARAARRVRAAAGEPPPAEGPVAREPATDMPVVEEPGTAGAAAAVGVATSSKGGP